MKLTAMRFMLIGAELDSSGGRAPSLNFPRRRRREGWKYRLDSWANDIRIVAALLACMALPVSPAVAAAEMTPEPTAIIQGLDKVAARVSRFEAPVGRAVQFEKLL